MNIKIYQLLISLNMSMHSWIKLNEIYVDTTYTFMHQDTRDIHVSSRNFFTMIWMNSIDFVTCFIIKLYVSCRFIDQYCSDIQVFLNWYPTLCTLYAQAVQGQEELQRCAGYLVCPLLQTHQVRVLTLVIVAMP